MCGGIIRAELLKVSSGRKVGHKILAACDTARLKTCMRTLPEYADAIHSRDDLIWPKPPAPKPAKAKPYSAHLPGLRAVTWDLYGTLLQVADGHMNFEPKPEIRLEVALEKTIHEFNMWNSMSRKPGAPSEYMLQQYRDVLADHYLRGGSAPRGEKPHVSLAGVWRVLIERLQQKDYEYDVARFGSLDHFSECVAYFFHSALQGTAAYPKALKVLKYVRRAGLLQGIVGDAQPYTFLHLVRALQEQGQVPAINKLFQPELMLFSFVTGARKPSPSSLATCAERLELNGISPGEVLHIGSRLGDDLLVAKKLGFKTALFAGDAASLDAPGKLLADKANHPDRLVTDLAQIARVVGGEG
ncbi:MAG: HAD family hydrolase [Planctomycetaceae bacterium]